MLHKHFSDLLTRYFAVSISVMMTLPVLPLRNTTSLSVWHWNDLKSTALLSKSRFGVPELDIFGCHIDATGIHPLEIWVQVIWTFPLPTTQHQLREFLGLVNFYHRLIPNCATIIQPSNSLLKHMKRPSDTLLGLSCHHNIKHALANASLLIHPTPDAPTNIVTDASDVAVGAVLHQYVNGKWCPLLFFSKALKSES